jgi:hypothetical protein
MAFPDVLMPSEWFSHEMQFEMLAAGIKTLVHTHGLSELFGYPMPDTDYVYLPAFGDFTLQSVYDHTGGNPLADYARSDLCIVITPTIDKFSYSKTIHGVPTFAKDLMGDDDTFDDLVYVEPGHLPYGFRESAERAQRIALDTIRSYTNQKFTVLGAKLSPLSSGKGNIAMFVHFHGGCPFHRQEFLESGQFDATMNKNIQIRLIPTPIISKFDEYISGLKFNIRYMEVDKNLYDMAFPILRHAVENSFKGSNLRFIKPSVRTNELVGVIQMSGEIFDEEIDQFIKTVRTTKYAPYILMDVQLSTVYIN